MRIELLVKPAACFTMCVAMVVAILSNSAASAAPLTVPGVMVAHSPAGTGIYLGSPSIAILADGTDVVSHDTFGPGSQQNVVELYSSHDKGRSWSKLAEVTGQYYSSLFTHRGALYLLGTSRIEGLPVIRRSTDSGRTWTNPGDAYSGLLASQGKYFSSAVSVVAANGRLWRSMETIERNGVWARMMSASVDSDLLKADSWTFTNGLGPNAQWLDGKFKGWLEGSAVVTPKGQVVDVLRVYYDFQPEKAAIVKVDGDPNYVSFDPQNGFIDLPGGGKKFTIRFDPRSKLYWSLTNAVLSGSYQGNNFERARNTLELISSPDLHTWTARRTVLHVDDAEKHGFQYVDWVFDGQDIAAAVRTSFDDNDGGAHSQHDSNFITFLRVPDFAHP
ncbi:hypothetical protein R69749_01169 [Paraburkholderia domus]|uniref:Exo-alpha-sialidase n=2 Tax=Paraburkholderia domus TaxID=2793075 RepID=A0A9N8MLX6_9BURK|nr:hypothetical protein R69749_01169 [Paraburkholderia domus]CAE6866626.1 hypothetical protein R70211_00850 [Paraburkholderia domus]